MKALARWHSPRGSRACGTPLWNLATDFIGYRRFPVDREHRRDGDSEWEVTVLDGGLITLKIGTGGGSGAKL